MPFSEVFHLWYINSNVQHMFRKIAQETQTMSEADRWDTARGMDGLSAKERRKKEKEKEAEQKRAVENYRDGIAAAGAIEVRSVNDWLTGRDEGGGMGDEAEEEEEGMSVVHELFAPFWYSGQLAVMMGPSGVGKSRLAMHIAASVAGLVNSEQLEVNRAGEEALDAHTCDGANERTTPPCRAPLLRKEGSFPQDEHSEKQVARRSEMLRQGPRSSPHCEGAEPELTTDHRAPSTVLYLDMERTRRQYGERYSGTSNVGLSMKVDLGLLGDVATPDRYKARRHKFLLAAVQEKLKEGHRVVIIDNLTWLMKGELAEIRSLMKGFRRWVNETGNSLLVLWHSSTGMPLSIQAAKFDLADSVFALRDSTMGENIRYLKSLRSGDRMASHHPAAEAATPLLRQEGSPFVRFDLQREVMVLRSTGAGALVQVGPSREVAHHHDYTADILAAKCENSPAAALLPAEKPVVIPRRFSFFEIDET
jgi:hypothetical protein